MDDVELTELYYALSAKFNECIARHRKEISCHRTMKHSASVPKPLRRLNPKEILCVAHLPAADS